MVVCIVFLAFFSVICVYCMILLYAATWRNNYGNWKPKLFWRSLFSQYIIGCIRYSRPLSFCSPGENRQIKGMLAIETRTLRVLQYPVREAYLVMMMMTMML